MAEKRSRRRFTDEFKAETVKQSDRTMFDIAMELGISAKAVGEWVNGFKMLPLLACRRTI